MLEALKVKCINCKKDMTAINTTLNSKWGDYSVTIRGVRAYQCDQCNEQVYSPNEVRMIQNITADLASFSSTESILDLSDYPRNE